VFPTLDSLGGGCDPDNLTSVFQLVFEFLHLDPQSDPRHGLYGEIIFAVVKEKVLSCIEAHYQLCKSRNDPTQVQLMLNLRMQLQLAQLLSDEEDAAIEDKIIKCLHFEIDFESALTVGLSMAGASFTYRLKVRAIVPVQVEYVQVGSNQRPLLRGSGTISYEFIDIQGPPCTFSVVTQPRTFTVDLLSIMRFKTDQTGEMAAVPRDEIQITMVFFTGEPQESFTMICPDEPGVTATSPFDSVFSAFYGILHQDEALPLGGYQIREQPPWEPIRSGNIFAKAQYVRTVSLPLFGPVPEETYIFLKHTPQ
jgi:hypothetical protein